MNSSRRSFCLVASLLLCLVFAPLAEARKKPKPSPAPAPLEAFRKKIESLIGSGPAEQAFYGIQIYSVTQGKTIFSLNANKHFMPASNTKLFTTVAAMALLGPDYRFHTTVEAAAPVDKYGRIAGDLSLIGRGDPNLSGRELPYRDGMKRPTPTTAVLDQLAEQVVAKGVKVIEGDLVADDSFFQYDRYPSGWTVDDVLWASGAPVTALALDDNVMQIELSPGEREGDHAFLSVEPWNSYYQFVNKTVTRPAHTEMRLGVHREPGSRTIEIWGDFPIDKEKHTLWVAIDEPALVIGELFRRSLEARGVRIFGTVRARHFPLSGTTPPKEEDPVLADHESLPLSEDLKVINKVSQNLHAEMIFRLLGREKKGAGTVEAASAVRDEFLQQVGVAKDDVALYDGSGLSRRNLVTPRALVTLLRSVEAQPWRDRFVDTLPVAGVDGTLAERMKKSPAFERVQAKTGTIGGVNALSGFATTLAGERLIFSIFVNHHTMPNKDSIAIIDQICAAMMELPKPAPARKTGKR